MKEKMDGLNKLVKGVDTYCNDNKIEYVFAATAEGTKFTLLSNNELSNTILKEAAKVLRTIIKIEK